MPFKQLLFLNYCNKSLRYVISNESSPIEREMLLKEGILRGVLILGLQMCAQDIFICFHYVWVCSHPVIRCAKFSLHSPWIPNSSVKLCCWDYLLLLDIVFLCLLYILLLYTCTHVCWASSLLRGFFFWFFSVLHLILAEKLSRLWSNTASISHQSVQFFNYFTSNGKEIWLSCWNSSKWSSNK